MIVGVDAVAEPLLAPVRDLIESAIERFEEGGPVRVGLGEVQGFYEVRGDTVVLSSALAGADHPDEHPTLGLDRWRRVTASVLEGVVRRGLPEDRAPDVPDWVASGLAVFVVDRLVPSLQLAAPERAWARQRGDLVRHPRAGEAVLTAVESQGHDPIVWARERLADGRVSMRDFVEAGRVVLSDHPAFVVHPKMAPVDVPADLTPWRWARLEVPAHERGGKVGVRGTGGVAPAWAPAGRIHRAIAGAGARGAMMVPELGGPIGSWDVRTAGGFGQVFGARGLRFVFGGGGTWEVLLADAFVGSVAELETAKRIGSSGTASGRWQVAGARQLRFTGVVTHGVTVHGRDDDPFAVPAPGGGMGSWVEAMQEGTWRWQQADDRLTLTGPIFGREVEIRLARA